MDEKKLHRYKEVHEQIKSLTEEKKDLSVEIIADLQKDKELNHRTDFGNFFLKSSPVYE